MDLKDIKAIIDLMKKNAISEFELERQDFKIKLRRGPLSNGTPDEWQAQVQAQALAALQAHGPLALPAGGAAQSASPPPAESSNASRNGELEIRAPMIGTFYRAPSPEAAPYVDVGTEVHPETVVCIIEAMKVMNEIKAEVKGVVTEVLVDNARPVEFGQPMFKVRPT